MKRMKLTVKTHTLDLLETTRFGVSDPEYTAGNYVTVTAIGHRDFTWRCLQAEAPALGSTVTITVEENP